MKIEDIIKVIEDKYPTTQAVEDDKEKIGYELTFDKSRDINSVILTLDVTPKVVDYAIDNNIKLIITHHPLFYKGMKEEVRESIIKSEMLSTLSQFEIEVYAAHTNIDVGEDGLSYTLLKKLDIKPISFIDEETKMGAIGYLESRQPLSSIINHFVKTLDLTHVKYWDFREEEYQRVAFIAGAGGYLINQIKKLNAEVLITSDIPWHTMVQLSTMELPTIEISHSVENIFQDLVEAVIKGANSKLEIVKFSVPDKSKVYSK